ncbi:MAG: hypothetical protein IJK72_02985 [Mycoplasma sp.]|nr:hypothetical protein [Mycoplasma sp.]
MPIIDLDILKQKNEEIYDEVSIISNSNYTLYIGEVQSGKTKKILDIINKIAQQELYDAVIYFGGTNNLLNTQSQERFFWDENKSPRILQYEANKKILPSISFTQFWHNSKMPFFVVLKGSDKLKTLLSFFQEIQSPKKKILIIDDEADFGSLKTTNSDQSINKLIGKISKFNWKKCTILEITATPFANIQMKNYDQILFLPSNCEYTGSNFFIKNKRYEIIDSNKNDSDELLNNVIFHSFIFWILSTSFYIYDTKKSQKSEFLINIDLKVPTHEKVRKHILYTIKSIKRYHLNFKTRFVKETFEYFNIFDEKIQNELLRKSEDIIQQIIEDDSIFTLNSKEINTYTTGQFKYSIVIGGTLISRGFTFKHLITELILNSPNEHQAIDTMFQRARWFGYRHEFDDMQKYMKIFMNQQVYDAYQKGDQINEFLKKHFNDKDLKIKLKNFYEAELKPYKIKYTHKKEKM